MTQAVKTYYDNSEYQLRSEGFELNGKKNGESKSYWENGQLSVIQFYIDGKKNGIYKEYYDNGQLKGICSYIDDKRNGECRTYWPSGQLYDICSYTNIRNYLIISKFYIYHHAIVLDFRDHTYHNNEDI